ncbi:Cyclic di-GMP phosphodiesterase response regulator RpfG [Hydrogenovibrio crunogenus]|uniref:Cyclic di-GMP phosphodiesterase response regulator RpfG n=1 Tax=Hydrogenovibrio crunogenus TaxID=39765 RepID=A0A4P7P1G2_9GAMM|nr:HD domain-containing phosphohydrolase [Hydrogenovibrio crunogenus]QBZ83951.1 Cyclic di-GMP phosphodiesterase response regulator RpfG [Hydrogenovibrio crunogenus]
MTQLYDARVLVLDDQQVNLDLVMDLLTLEGYKNIQLLNDPLQLSAVLASQPIDLILLDINMPILDGFAALAMIKQHYHEQDAPPVVMLTAQNDQENRLRALKNGASDYVMKPFNRHELLKRIEIQLENWQMKMMLKEQNRLLEQKVQERTQALEEAHHEIIYRLGRASEYRDNETGNHVKRVSYFSELIALEAGLDKKEAHMIRIASPMHDVGKIGISDTIMMKPGKLSEAEYLEMQRHVEIGGEILEGHDSNVLKTAYEIALTHHEKFDGKGYPKGLSGKDIPISGRIVAIADVFDALTSERPYKEAWPVEKAVHLIKSEKNKHFDPELVECFLAVLPQIIQIKDKYSDKTST